MTALAWDRRSTANAGVVVLVSERTKVKIENQKLKDSKLN
jgi:hypothetical protein